MVKQRVEYGEENVWLYYFMTAELLFLTFLFCYCKVGILCVWEKELCAAILYDSVTYSIMTIS